MRAPVITFIFMFVCMFVCMFRECSLSHPPPLSLARTLELYILLPTASAQAHKWILLSFFLSFPTPPPLSLARTHFHHLQSPGTSRRRSWCRRSTLRYMYTLYHKQPCASFYISIYQDDLTTSTRYHIHMYVCMYVMIMSVSLSPSLPRSRCRLSSLSCERTETDNKVIFIYM